MSYCRWSSDDFRCDLYIYESDNGYYIHVANMRHRGPIPKITANILKEDKLFWKQYDKQSKYLENCGLRRIRLKYAGKHFFIDNLEELLTKIKELRKIGFRCPKYVDERIKDEIKEKK